MDIARWSITRPLYVWLIVVLTLVGGLFGFFNIGRLEDPSFTIKEAFVVAEYPGASSTEVEQEVTETLETYIQQLGQLDEIESRSVPGRSEIRVRIRDEFGGEELPQVWDELRRKVGQAELQLPPGAGPVIVNDDFSQVYGMFFALTAEGYSEQELYDYAKTLRRDLLTVDGVARVELIGQRPDRIYVDVAQGELTRLGLPPEQLFAPLTVQNQVEPTGRVRVGDESIRVAPTGAFDSVEAVRESILLGEGGGAVRLGDVAKVSREPVAIPDQLVYFDGQRAIGLGIAAVPTANVVDVGARVQARLAELEYQRPIGIELHPIYQQPRIVEEAVNGFVLNLLTSVAIVVGVLCLFMGWRPGILIGSVLFLTVIATILIMYILGIEMERISLGALIIAMGMLVDNAIVVGEGMLIGMRKGQKPVEAASAIVKQTQVPLLGATIIGILAFAGIGLSNDSTGEYTFSLFAVITISLLLSWVFAITVTPLFGSYILKRGDQADGEDTEQYRGRMFSAYRTVLRRAVQARWVTVAILIGATGAAVFGFGFVKQSFFPNSATPIFFVDYWRAEGTDIRATAADIREIEEEVRAREGVTSVASFVGQGALRFSLTYEPERPNPAYAQMIVRVDDADRIDALARSLVDTIGGAHPAATVRTRRVRLGPGGGAKIEARLLGPDADTLRILADRVEKEFYDADYLTDIRTDWRQRTTTIVPVLAEDRARIAGITRQDVAEALALATDGTPFGLYREGDDLIPIVVRAPDEERDDPRALEDRLIWSDLQRAYVPISNLLRSLDTRTEDRIIRRLDRVRTLTVQADPIAGVTSVDAFSQIRPAIDALELPAGYGLEWGGEYEDSSDAQSALFQQIPLSFLGMVLITILLFGKLRQPTIIWLIVPMSIIGVTVGLLVTGIPFGFMALLGFLSLSGMLIKNAIVLVDEIDTQIASERPRFRALVDASVSRLRPVMLAAVTTILGMAPLVGDVFFADMAATIMGGLAFATVLTLIAVPTLYAIFFRINTDEA
ncbi:efflux RND transporter permease subunit [Parvularcula oceani]|uniref:efflux RND transporter permease subunit n=1 Tax=Parvularcula oceani TaxID=1247963 RepID=UPI0004E27F48|nr:efflux RND transporter permease subunit [Parvularcula oceani]